MPDLLRQCSIAESECSEGDIKIVIISMSYMYLKVGMTHFYHLALYNLVLGLTNI